MSGNPKPNLNDPKAVSEVGRRIYESKFKAEYESKYFGRFVAIDVIEGSATLGTTSVEALNEAKRLHPNGFFHLIRIGHKAAFEAGPSYHHVAADRLSG